MSQATNHELLAVGVDATAFDIHRINSLLRASAPPGGCDCGPHLALEMLRSDLLVTGT